MSNIRLAYDIHLPNWDKVLYPNTTYSIIHDVALKFHQCRKFIHKIFLYTGWIFGLSSENVESRSRLQRDSIASSSTTSTVLENNNAVQIKMEKLRRELEMLQTKVVEERERQFSNYKVWYEK